MILVDGKPVTIDPRAKTNLTMQAVLRAIRDGREITILSFELPKESLVSTLISEGKLSSID